MTKVVIRKKANGKYVGFELNGHAGSGEYGKDIVCAAISILSINTVNSIEELTDDNISYEADSQKGMIKLMAENGFSKEGELLMSSYELGIMSVFKQYGNEFLNIKFEEV